jgi:hypothetical protein
MVARQQRTVPPPELPSQPVFSIILTATTSSRTLDSDDDDDDNWPVDGDYDYVAARTSPWEWVDTSWKARTTTVAVQPTSLTKSKMARPLFARESKWQ